MIQIDLTDKLYNYRAANEKRAQKHYLKTLRTKITVMCQKLKNIERKMVQRV